MAGFEFFKNWMAPAKVPPGEPPTSTADENAAQFVCCAFVNGVNPFPLVLNTNQSLKLAYTADAHAFDANLADLKQQVLLAAGLSQA